MVDEGIVSAKSMSSFLLESIVYNCPEATFQQASHLDDLKATIIHLWSATEHATCENALFEVNGIKYLFHSLQAWDRATTRTFLQDAWNYVGFDT